MLIALVPVFNEEATVLEFLNKLKNAVDYIVIVDDGSFDRTSSIISDWIRNRENVHYCRVNKNRGMSYALKRGFDFILEEYKKGRFIEDSAVVTIDADGQHKIESISGMYEYFREKGLGVLIARRDFRFYPCYRILGNNAISCFASWLGGFRFRDVECGLKVIKVSAIADLMSYYLGYRYSCACEIAVISCLLEFKIDNNYVIEVPYYRKRGPGIADFFINLLFCAIVSLRVRFSGRGRDRARSIPLIPAGFL